jgi:EAL domain-containing protein (putative c-di-GMP-specific phosphodiesterase class I)
VPVSVNLSRNDIKGERNIPEYVNSLVKKYGLDVDQLRIEITETAYVEDPDVLISITERLRDLGFHVEMDDFGSGYSSLHMLKEVPVDRIKLDLHFLVRKGDPERARIIIRHITQMIGSLGMDMITEGVETKEQAEFLYSTGCSEMQGYYFHKPMPVQEFEKVLDNNHGES